MILTGPFPPYILIMSVCSAMSVKNAKFYWKKRVTKNVESQKQTSSSKSISLKIWTPIKSWETMKKSNKAGWNIIIIIYLFICLFIHLFIYSFIYLFTYLFNFRTSVKIQINDKTKYKSSSLQLALFTQILIRMTD